MQTYQQTLPTSYQRTEKQVSGLTRFLQWSAEQEPNRLLWLAGIIALHGCVLAPITLLFVFSAGNQMLYFALTTISMAMCLFTNLAAMPTKITIPVFFFSLLINAAVILACIKEILF